MTGVYFLNPRRLPNQMLVEVFPAASEVGGYEVIIWRNDARDDGFMVQFPTMGKVHRFLREIGKSLSEGTA